MVYNWSSLFVRLADPQQHTEGISRRLRGAAPSRPLMLHAIDKQTRHAGQTRVTITSARAEANKVMAGYRRIAAFFKQLWATAERLTSTQRWCRILS